MAHDQSRLALAAKIDELFVYKNIVIFIWGTKTSKPEHMPMFFCKYTTKMKLTWCLNDKDL